MRGRPSQLGLINTWEGLVLNGQIGRWRLFKGEDSGVRRSSPLDLRTGIMSLSS